MVASVGHALAAGGERGTGGSGYPHDPSHAQTTYNVPTRICTTYNVLTAYLRHLFAAVDILPVLKMYENT
jgi:hypothetical protein